MREENARLKRIVADLAVDKAMLQDVLTKRFKALKVSSGGVPPEEQLHELAS
jgi:hypothetical protein